MKIKEYKAVLAGQIPEMKEICEHETETEQVKTPADIVSIACDQGLGESADERLLVMCFNTHMNPIALFEASHGGAVSAICPKREILQKALLLNAVSIALAHNHPSGNESPSPADYKSTKDIGKGCKAVGINLVDHVIVTPRNTYWSFCENRCL